MKTALYRRSRWRRANTAWRPLALPVHLSRARMPANSPRFFSSSQLFFGQIVHDLAGHQSAGESRTELQSRLAARVAPAQVDLQLRRVFDQPAGDLHQLGLGHRQPGRRRQARGQQLIGQHAHVLRIVLELHDVDMAVRAQHQLALRAASHAPDLLHRQNRQ